MGEVLSCVPRAGGLGGGGAQLLVQDGEVADAEEVEAHCCGCALRGVGRWP